jgi:hypothetical protein
MSDLSFEPPSLDFDARDASHIGSGRGRSPFDRYTRALTSDGGVLICYRDQLRSPVLAFLRVFTWFMGTGLTAWLIDTQTSWPARQSLLVFSVATFLITLIVRRRFPVSHSIEIRPDAMIVDGEDVFFAKEIGDNWPQLQMKNGDPDQSVLGFLYGTRLIELSASRWDKYDRTPEILESDLKIVMEQLWGRREVSFPAPH